MAKISFSLEGRRALVVGADFGIGLACATAIAEAGADLVIAGLDRTGGPARAEEIARQSGTRVHCLTVDVRDEQQVAAMVGQAVELLGGLDIAMNNAGIPGPAGAIHELATEDYDNLFAINVRGAWLSMKYEIPHMLEGGRGSIINLASTAATGGLPFVGAYAATKHAIAGLTRSAGLELADRNIRVNAIAPGPVATNLLDEMTSSRDFKGFGSGPGGATGNSAVASRVPMARISQPDEMAGSVVWLASDASSYVTGSIVAIDGGVTAR